MLACDVPTYLCAVLQIGGWSVHFNDVVEPVNSSPVSHHHVCHPWQQPVRENDVRGGSARRLACPPQRGRGHIASPRGEAGAGERRPRAKRAHCLPNEAQRRQLGGAGVGFSVSRGEVKLEGGRCRSRARYPWPSGRGIPGVAGQAQRILKKVLPARPRCHTAHSYSHQFAPGTPRPRFENFILRQQQL